MSRLIALPVALVVLALSGCAQPSAEERAWDNCIRVSKVITDGDIDAARAECERAKDALYPEEFIETYGDLYD